MSFISQCARVAMRVAPGDNLFREESQREERPGEERYGSR